MRYAIIVSLLLPGCLHLKPQGHPISIEWPADDTPATVSDFNASGIIAARAALEKVLDDTKDIPELYYGCSRPEDGLGVRLWDMRTYWVVDVSQHFNRCKGHTSVGRVLDWSEIYAVSPDGQVLARMP